MSSAADKNVEGPSQSTSKDTTTETDKSAADKVCETCGNPVELLHPFAESLVPKYLQAILRPVNNNASTVKQTRRKKLSARLAVNGTSRRRPLSQQLEAGPTSCREDTLASKPQDASSNSGKSSHPDQSSGTSSPFMAATGDAGSNPPKSPTPPTNGRLPAGPEKQQTQTKMDAEPVATVIDDIPSSRGQSSVQHDQGLPGGKKREGEPNPGQQDAKKPRLDNGASPAFVHKTVATVAGLSGDYRPVGCQLIAYQTQGARTNVTRAVGSNTTWAAQPQQLLGKEELRKMVEEKVAHCTAKANSQMKQLQDRVAKLTKVCKGWEEYARKLQASGRKPSGAGPPPLLKAVSEPSPPPNTVAPAAQARPTSQVCPFNNPQQAAPVSVNTSRKVSEVLQAIMNTARNIQAPPNFRTVTTSVQQVGQSLHTLPSTAPTYRRPPLQSSVGYVGGQPVVPHVQQRTGTFRPPDVTTSTYVVQPSRVVENTLSPAMCMRPSQPGNPLYNHYSQPQRHPVHSVGVPPARHPMPYRQPFQQVRPPASMMQAPRPTGPPILSRPAPPPLLHSNNPPQVHQMRPPMQPSFPPRPPPLQQQQQPPNHTQHHIAGLPLPHRTTLQIARVGNIIALTWDVSEPPNPRSPTLYCYQLFAYQEGTGQPNTALWKKIGDVKALPLPMACTLTNFLPRGTYHFAVRAMDVYSTDQVHGARRTMYRTVGCMPGRDLAGPRSREASRLLPL
ncbi:Activating transcription factor 7-interacting protein 1 [Branchiostoma belcheri]|nr:Activating transcription factor 7-interacting protein 1 [Branchiostoma belcheri]